MKFFKNKKKLCKEIKGFKNIGFVPTLGGLHKGHEALIKKSIKISNKTLVSIFLNPRQFENKKDFKNYPKNYKNDISSIYVNRGPGSYAGIRNSLSTVKAINLAKKIDYYSYSLSDFDEIGRAHV